MLESLARGRADAERGRGMARSHGSRAVYDPDGMLGSQPEGLMRYEATATCLSWIPPAAVEIAVLARGQLDSQALLGAAAEAASLLDAWRANHEPS